MTRFHNVALFAGILIFLACTAHATELTHWPRAERHKLIRLIERNAYQGKFAVFDCDNTVWYQKLEESLLPYLENRGLMGPEALAPSLKVIPFLPDDTLTSYACRLYDIDNKVGSPWMARVFAGFTLEELKGHVDDLFALNGASIPAKHRRNGELVDVEVEAPRIYPGMRELINAMQENGIEVIFISTALEELVRMVACDPRYGLNIKPENVIGVSTLLKDRETGEITTARLQIERGHFFDETYPKARHMAMELTPTLWSPNTMYFGKVWAIKDYIHPVNRPVLVAGDSPNDHPMLFEAEEFGGIKLWINHREADWKATKEARKIRARQQQEAWHYPSANKRWLMVRPADIGIL
ncbi:haloacid dehalogenase-like hydrolase [Desulfoluna spongiiphila]|uniref:haloacid dehalogenase-like hydrolase n=1 Tax=Desulfoluna spongiiphila TaxID=419481 RepID=UPI0012520E98|nr:HAD family hydrolase [Desulfoluna spongiiphila]VVS92424.1 prokaryotic membrane lipoprotein lipid attachment site profile [Desulfoluna spongiiphila]